MIWDPWPKASVQAISSGSGATTSSGELDRPEGAAMPQPDRMPKGSRKLKSGIVVSVVEHKAAVAKPVPRTAETALPSSRLAPERGPPTAVPLSAQERQAARAEMERLQVFKAYFRCRPY